MKRKKNRFLTFLFSLWPGAGHMYMGLMQRGGAYMTLFVGVLMISAYLNLSVLTFLEVVIWFYAFFDSWNISSMNDEDFNALKDQAELFGFPLRQQTFLNNKARLFVGVTILFIGIYALFQNTFNSISGLLAEVLSEAAYSFIYALPRIFIALGLIYIGYRLIKQNKQNTEEMHDAN